MQQRDNDNWRELYDNSFLNPDSHSKPVYLGWVIPKYFFWPDETPDFREPGWFFIVFHSLYTKQ